MKSRICSGRARWNALACRLFTDLSNGKTHAKISMVVRKEQEGYRTYCHFGTGNYHPITAKIYTDLSFFTADPRAARDAAQLFNYITGYVEPKALELISMSPRDMRNDLMGLIDQEIANCPRRQGPAWSGRR